MNVKRILAEMAKLPPMPRVVQRVLALLQDPEVPTARLIETVELDPSLTANVLRLCNSAYFGARRKVTSLQQALIMIGHENLLDIVISQGSAAYFSRPSRGYDLARGELWRHSVATALNSQILSRRLGGRGDPMLYTAALLHDIGKVVLSEHVAESLEGIRALVRERGCSFEEAELAVVGIDHAELGARLCELWDFPADLVAAIRYHHHPDREAATPLSGLVCVSDLICLLLGIGAGADGLAYHGGDPLVARLGLSEVDIHMAMAELADELGRAESMLDIGGQGGGIQRPAC